MSFRHCGLCRWLFGTVSCRSRCFPVESTSMSRRYFLFYGHISQGGFAFTDIHSFPVNGRCLVVYLFAPPDTPCLPLCQSRVSRHFHGSLWPAGVRDLVHVSAPVPSSLVAQSSIRLLSFFSKTVRLIDSGWFPPVMHSIASG